jgi:hypothetical protein
LPGDSGQGWRSIIFNLKNNVKFPAFFDSRPLRHGFQSRRSQERRTTDSSSLGLDLNFLLPFTMPTETTHPLFPLRCIFS